VGDLLFGHFRRTGSFPAAENEHFGEDAQTSPQVFVWGASVVRGRKQLREVTNCLISIAWPPSLIKFPVHDSKHLLFASGFLFAVSDWPRFLSKKFGVRDVFKSIGHS
jgi:hypothetical protein